MDIREQLQQAESSAYALWKLKRYFYRLVPFNQTHKISLSEVKKDGVIVSLPFIKKNCNHLKGIHACALLTAAEFSAGVTVLKFFDMTAYRLIMQEISARYHAQAWSDVKAVAQLGAEQRSEIQVKLSQERVAQVPMQVQLFDSAEKEIATVSVMWQLKSWQLVKNKKSAG